WAILAVLLVLAETFTLGFVLLWFGLGAAAAALVSIAGGGIFWQIAVFIIVSGVLTALSRTIFSNYLHRDENQLKSGIEGLPGQIGTVSSPSRGALKEAAVRVYGSVWTAYPADGESTFAEGEKVEVVSVKGSSIYVRKVEPADRNWLQEEDRKWLQD
ncbi:MAG TPA: NfeD family protein, partial [Pyrinomonadaceae bacterium]|nr:NfeD family protein [Pyrinomonadaceae bacterium]